MQREPMQRDAMQRESLQREPLHREPLHREPIVPVDGYYWYAKSHRSSLAELCEWAVDEASTAKEIAAVAHLVAGAGLSDLLGPTLEGKILDRLRAGREGKHTSEVLKEARWMGEALEALQRLPGDR